MYLSLFILLTFFLLSLAGIFHHEIWLDEAQHFLIARDSHTLSGLFDACRREGHPLLWNIILFLVTRFSSNPFYMQLVHILISTTTVAIILKTNLSTAEKILIIFGYFLFYEYNIISRNYGLSVLLMIFLMYSYKKNYMSLVKLAVILFFLAQTHLFSLLFSFAFVLTYILIYRNQLLKQTPKTLFIVMLVVLSGWLISAYCIFPSWSYGNKFLSYDSTGYFSSARIIKTLSVCLKGIFYIPDYNAADHHFINSFYYMTLNLTVWVKYLLSFVAIAVPVFILRVNRFALMLFCSFLLIFIPVYFFLPLVYGIRYFGFFYVVFVCCYLIARPEISKTGIVISILIFFLQFLNGFYAYSMDLRYPFSEGKDVSNYLKKVRINNEKVFILNRTLRPAISAYTGEKFFGIENGQPLSYCLWDKRLPDSILKYKLTIALNSDITALIIDNTPFHELVDTTKVLRLASFNNGIFAGENATIYRYRK
jgi:hypothetical protein